MFEKMLVVLFGWFVGRLVGFVVLPEKKQREGKHGTDFLKAFKFEGNPLNLHCGV